jgi:hypothetical protein
MKHSVGNVHKRAPSTDELTSSSSSRMKRLKKSVSIQDSKFTNCLSNIFIAGTVKTFNTDDPLAMDDYGAPEDDFEDYNPEVDLNHKQGMLTDTIGSP